MGILDMLTSVMAARAAKDLDPALIPVVLGEVLGNGSEGGLSAIVARLQQGGFGDQVESWIGTGGNLPISAQQLQDLLGNATVRQLATRFGIPVDQLSTVLAQVLPVAVDQASPDGKLPRMV
jgi:uncharacterized protein YidB (DUF937 family)